MNLFFYPIIFIFGLIVGSFLNCVIYRLALQNFSEKNLGGQEKRESFLKGRSYCPQCKHLLNWQDLIPVFSFLILKGKCRYCKKPISLQYPLVELATGGLFLLIFNFQQFGPELTTEGFLVFNFLNLIYYWIIFCFLIVIFVFDLRHYIIPDKVIYPAIIIALIFNSQFLISKQFSIFNYSILSAFGAAVFFLAIVLISRGKWMGIGDIKLTFFMGLFLGFPNILVAIFLSFILGAIIGIELIISGKKTLKSEIPFGPFLVTGTIIGFFWGQEIINWYLNLFL
jgi:prepilin signal peptidase PulO-like enzyme (type II secretory pathway)